MPFTARCWMRPRAARAAATLLLSACATAGSDPAPGACPPVVGYAPAEQLQVAREIAALPEGALLPAWLADYAVLRDQARACRAPGPR
ncbi:MAG: hypothetical protein JJU42_05955 [Rhodobacteraceae bacterium]|nr:hypothetical protein [Paracoccaceae bacterium]